MTALQPRYDRLKEAGKCVRCAGERDSEFQCCSGCRADLRVREKRYRATAGERDSTSRVLAQRNAYRVKHGIPLDAPVRMGRWHGKPGQCDRCSQPAVTTTDRGEKACERHVAIFAELAADRVRGLVIDIDEEGDE